MHPTNLLPAHNAQCTVRHEPLALALATAPGTGTGTGAGAGTGTGTDRRARRRCGSRVYIFK